MERLQQVPSQAKAGPCSPISPGRRVGRRGFTLLEVLAVVMLIGTMAALASPSFLNLMRDRRVNRAAMSVAEIYRTARMRALGRGGATLVRYIAAGGVNGGDLFMLKEAVQQTDTTPLPVSSCLTTNWANASTTSRYVTKFDPGRSDLFELTAFQFLSAAGVALQFHDVCFSPRGRAWERAAAGAAFTELTGVPRITVTNTRTNLVRAVFLPPNGAARLQL